METSVSLYVVYLCFGLKLAQEGPRDEPGRRWEANQAGPGKPRESHRLIEPPKLPYCLRIPSGSDSFARVFVPRLVCSSSFGTQIYVLRECGASRTCKMYKLHECVAFPGGRPRAQKGLGSPRISFRPVRRCFESFGDIFWRHSKPRKSSLGLPGWVVEKRRAV
jgi:hypothetical protein